jgi:hypothetical protein
MKKTLLTLLSVLFCAITFAQSVPQGINYQAVARDASGAVLMNQNLTIQFSVISDITTGNVSWQETHAVNTNDYGLYTAIIGQGTTTSVGSSATFDVIDWGASNHLLKVEVDFGSGYLDMGTTAFMSVPYALNSTPQSLTISGDTLFISSGNYIILPSSAPTLLGCTDATATNYDPLANTDDGSCAYPLAIGDTHQGGIIFWLDGNGGGLIAAPSDQSSGAQWGCYGTNITGAGGTAIGTGTQNTIDIINANCTSSNGSPTAADICANLSLGGYSDWFLPSKDELNEMYLNKAAIGGFAGIDYWSSTEDGNLGARDQYFASGSQNFDFKYGTNGVRAVRAFGNVTIITGCTDPTATNYNAAANTDDGSCIAVVNGCTDSTAFNYNALANTDDGSCIAVVNGCTDSTATNYNAAANTDDASCIAVVNGCTDSTATNYNPLANTDDGSCCFNGNVCIGSTYQGGIIFYLDGNGGGLISTPTDLTAEWGCFGTAISGADGTAIGTGNQNTIDILNGCTTPNTAADICDTLTLGGYNDWFLPSIDELNEMYLNIGQGNALGLGNLGGFLDWGYWSSSEYNNDNGWGFWFFVTGGQGLYNKGAANKFRAIRAF